MDALCGSKIKISKFGEPFLRFFDLMSEKAFDIDCEEMTKMEDSRIVELYWRRSGDAIAETRSTAGIVMQLPITCCPVFRTRRSASTIPGWERGILCPTTGPATWLPF